jgi:hypothetical protein
MKALLGCTLAAVLALARTAGAQAAAEGGARPQPARSPLVGAWRLAWLDQPEPDGTIRRITDAKGSLIYTADGYVSVQVMFATVSSSSSAAPVQYAENGYEASFGRYEVDTATRTVTHRYTGSLVRSLLGQDLPRRYQLVDGRLMIRSTRPDEHWSVAWERD